MQVSKRIMEEAFVNGDVERNEGVAVQKINDRDRRDDAKFHLLYIEHVVTPHLQAVSNIFPTLNRLGACLSRNMQSWLVEWEKNNPDPPREDVAKLKRKVLGVMAICGEMRAKEDFR